MARRRSATPTTPAPSRARAHARIVVVAACLLAGSAVAATPAPAGADHLADDLADVRAQREAAQARADDAAARIADAFARLGELDTRIAELEQAIADGEARAAELEAIARRRAVEAYMGGSAAPATLFADGEVLDPARRVALLEVARADENDAIDQLGSLTEDLETQRAELEAGRAEQSEVLVGLRADQELIQQELIAAGEAEALLIAAIDDERAAQARRAAEAAAATAGAGSSSPVPEPASPAPEPTTTGSDPTASTPDTTDVPAAAPDGAPDPPPEPPATGIVCPIAGPVSFVDSWGAPRSGGRTHEGVDLMSPAGTPNVAVVSGTISHDVGALAGNSVYLHGDDGNSYWYFHLAAWEGGPRRVAQGEVIGYTGDTGNATGTYHTHFEYHPGGGGAVNPYPLVAEVC